MAAFHAGAFPFNCEACQHDPGLMEKWGCDKPTQDAVWETEEDQFYSCPLKWINTSLSNWYEEINYYKEFGGAPKYEELNPAWLEALHYYNRQYRFFVELVTPKSKGSTDQGLSVLRDSFRRRTNG